MKSLFFVCLFFLVSGLFAVPLESGYSIAPRASASADEKARAYLEARNRVINASVKYENTPYRYGGMTASGLDCSGFICLSFKDALGVTLPRSSAGLYSWAERIPIDKAQPGDLLFFRTDSSGNISHVGLYLGSRRFIHSASAGPNTGVIYSTLDESYWSRTFAGAGRVFPEIPAGYSINNAHLTSGANSGAKITTSAGGRQGAAQSPSVSSTGSNARFLAGAAFAPTISGVFGDGVFIRGFASQLRVGVETSSFGLRMIFGFEVRPEYDGTLGVFRLPLTLSWGLSDKIRIFAGPVFSFGDASISIKNEDRQYSGGTNWLGTIGLTAAPFIFKTSGGEFAPYFEAAWQSYISDSANMNLNADFSASFRFSTGIRWTMRI